MWCFAGLWRCECVLEGGRNTGDAFIRSKTSQLAVCLCSMLLKKRERLFNSMGWSLYCSQVSSRRPLGWHCLYVCLYGKDKMTFTYWKNVRTCIVVSAHSYVFVCSFFDLIRPQVEPTPSENKGTNCILSCYWGGTTKGTSFVPLVCIFLLETSISCTI